MSGGTGQRNQRRKITYMVEAQMDVIKIALLEQGESAGVRSRAVPEPNICSLRVK